MPLSFRTPKSWRQATALILSSLLLAGAAQAQQLLPEHSSVEFVSKQMGVPVSGKFTRFEGDIRFNPDQLEDASITLSIDTGSASLGIRETDAELPKPEWFNVLQFPQARFVSSSVKATGDNSYEVAGKLSIKGQSQPVTVPVELQRDGAQGTASGAFTIERLGFGIGDGEWADTSMVANEVQVRFRLALSGL